MPTPHPLWAVTTYFNPSKYRTRSDNYRLFRQRSRAQGLPLITVELAPEGHGFELEAGRDAEVLIQCTSDAFLWHKERLLNLALAKLPPQCRFVCWIDADVLFEDDDWIGKATHKLGHNAVIQPFDVVYRQPRRGASTRPSLPLGHRLAVHLPTKTYTRAFAATYRPGRRQMTGTTGYAWCARRQILDTHGFYDRCIVGGGDREHALAFIWPSHAVPDSELRIRHGRLRDHIRRWHDGVYADVRGDLSYIDGTIVHLWHGDSKHRGYTNRHAILERHDFDPDQDIVLDAGGCWAYADGTEALAGDVKKYFASRREDG